MMEDLPPSLDSYQLADRLGISVRTLRTWVKANLIPTEGTRFRFDRRAIVIAHAVAALRRDGVPLTHVRRFLAKKSDAELRELGGLPPAPPPPASIAALPSHAASAQRATPAPEPSGSIAAGSIAAEPPAAPDVVSPSGDALAVRASPLAPREAPAAGAPVGSEWRRIELLPGLELHVRADAPPFVHGLAAAIAAGRLPK